MSVPAYPSYKDSGVEWLGKIPAHWSVRKLKFSAQLVTEKAMKKSNPVALENIESWTGRYLPTETEFEGDGVSFRLNDILFGKLRPYLAKALLANEPGEAVGDFHVFRPNGELLPKFLHLQVLEQKFIDIVDGSTFGSKMPRASWEHVGAMPLPLPPLAEQISITEFLEQETAKIDALIEEQGRFVALLEEERSALISSTVTKGLNSKVEFKNSGTPWLGDIPSHWGVGGFRNVTSRVVVGIAEAATHAYTDIGVPILRSTNIRPNSIEGEILHVQSAFALERASKQMHRGDLVSVRTGNAGVTAVIPEEFDGAHCFTMLISTLVEGNVSDFYSYFLNSASAQAYFSLEGWGTAQVNISVPILKSIQVPIPPEDEQKAIVVHLKNELHRIDKVISEQQRMSELLAERRSALISAAVTGKIDVRGFVAPAVQ